MVFLGLIVFFGCLFVVLGPIWDDEDDNYYDGGWP